MSKMMKAARLHAVGDFRVDMMDIPQPTGEELLVKVGACGVCGSDLPRIYAHGTSNGKYPMVIGHEFAGTVVAVGEKADPKLIGQKGAIFPLIPCRECDACLTGHYAMCSDYDYTGSRRDGGFAEYCLLPSAWQFVPSSNENTPMTTLAMAEPACVAQHAVRASGVSAGMSLIIYGAGPIGILAARWARLNGASHILLVDVADDKVDFARARGFDAVNALKENPADVIKQMTGGRLADASIEGVGAGSALVGCINSTRALGTVVLLGNPGGDAVLPLKEHSTILRKELTLKGVWNSNYSPLPINEWHCTVSMMDQGLLVTEDLITHRASIDALPALVEGVHNKTVSICKAMCVPE